MLRTAGNDAVARSSGTTGRRGVFTESFEDGDEEELDLKRARKKWQLFPYKLIEVKALRAFKSSMYSW